MTQDQLLEGRAYWVKEHTSDEWWSFAVLTAWENKLWWYFDDQPGIESDEASEWILIPTAEEIQEQRKQKAESAQSFSKYGTYGVNDA